MREADLHQNVCDYLKLQYPGVLFRTDMGGVRLKMHQAIAAKKTQAGRAWPDLFIAEPRGQYHGLFIELKREGTKLWLKDGVTLVANEHFREQQDSLTALRSRGYAAYFGIGFNECREIIDHYLSLAE